MPSKDTTPVEPTEPKPAVNPGTEGDKKDPENPQNVPYDRFSQVVQERNKLREYRDQVEKAKQEEETQRLEKDGEYQTLLEQTRNQLAEAQAKAAKLTAAMAAAGLNETTLSRVQSIATRLQGDTPEALQEDAKAVAELFRISPEQKSPGNPPPPRGGGETNPLDVSNLSPAEIRAKAQDILKQFQS